MKRVDRIGDRELVTAGQLAAYLGVAPRTVSRWRQAGLIPFVELPGGSSFRYDRAAVEATLIERGVCGGRK